MPGILDFLGSALGGGLLGGQPAPQQRQAPRELPGYGGAENNPLTAGLYNFLGAGSPAGAIGGLIQGLSTGQRTDPVGAYQQQANLTYRMLLNAGVPDAQAQLGAVNPLVQKEIIGRMFPHWKFQDVGGTLVPTEETSGRINAGGAYTAPKTTALSPGQGVFQSNPMVGGQDIMPPPGGVPGTQSPITRAPLAPIPMPGPEIPGATSAGGRPASPTTGAPLGGPGTPQSLPPVMPGVPAGAPLPPTVGAPGAGGRMLVQPMSIAEEARQRAAGGIAGKAGQTLSPVVTDLQNTIDMIDTVKKHPGKYAAVGHFYGMAPAVYGQGADFVRLLDQLQTQAAPQLDPKANEKTKVSVTGLDRRVDPAQFDRQLDALRKTLTDKINAAREVAGQPGAPEAPVGSSPLPAGVGAPGASAAGQGAPDGGGWINMVGGGRVRLMPGR